MGLLDYFRILKTLIILFLLFVCMNYVPNKNWEVLEETPPGFNSDDVKTTLKRLRCFKMTLSFSKFFKNLSPFICLFLYTLETITKGF